MDPLGVNTIDISHSGKIEQPTTNKVLSLSFQRAVFSHRASACDMMWPVPFCSILLSSCKVLDNLSRWSSLGDVGVSFSFSSRRQAGAPGQDAHRCGVELRHWIVWHSDRSRRLRVTKVYSVVDAGGSEGVQEQKETSWCEAMWSCQILATLIIG